MALGVTPTEIVESGRYSLLEKSKDWDRILLDEIATVQNGYAFESDKFTQNGGIPLIRIRDVGKNNTEDNYKGEYDKDYIVRSGDLLVGMDGDFRCAVWNGPDGLLNQRVCRIKLKSDSFSKKFLFYLLQPYLDAIHAETSSVTVKHLSSKTIRNIPLPNPPLPIQHHIVEKIEELLSDLDNGIENLKKAKQQLETYKQSVLKAAFEGTLTKEWREQQDNLPTPEELKQQIEEERKHYREQQLEEWKEKVKEWEEQGEPGRKPWKPRKPKELDPINEDELKQFDNIPNYWGVEKLGNLFSVHVGSTPKRKEPKYWDGEINWVSSGEVGFRRIKKTEEKITQLGLENSSTDVHPVGTVMLGMIGQGKTRGQAAILDIPACHNQNTAAIRVPELDYSPELLYYYFYYNYQRTREIGSGNNQKALNKNRVRNIEYLVIPPSEQKVLIEKIESRFSIIEQVSKTIEQELQKAESLRQSILKKAFEGKLVSQEISEKEFQKPLQKYYKNTATDLHAGLMAKIISLHHQNDKYLNKLNHVKCEKNIHMIESHLGVDLQRQPVKDAAGPDDYTRLKKIEHRANRKNWFVKDTKLGGEFGYGYKPKKSIDYAISDLNKVDDLPMQEINSMINLFLPMSKEQAEVVATLYAAWNNFLIESYQPTDDEIVQAAREDWSKQKLKIKRHKFVKALSWMREKELIPSGEGKYVKDKTEK